MVAAATLAAACASATTGRAGTADCGPSSYAYAGVTTIDARYGVEADLAAIRRPTVRRGHVAAWVGVGGYGLGPNGTSEWLQVGISAQHGQDPALYYELARPYEAPRYVMLHAHVRAGASYRVAVLESRLHPGWWRVWVNGARMTSRIYLPGSHGAWRAVATAESWNGNAAGTCNAFAFRFAHMRVAASPGGSWQPLRGRVLADAGYRVLQSAPDSLVALGG